MPSLLRLVREAAARSTAPFDISTYGNYDDPTAPCCLLGAAAHDPEVQAALGVSSAAAAASLLCWDYATKEQRLPWTQDEYASITLNGLTGPATGPELKAARLALLDEVLARLGE